MILRPSLMQPLAALVLLCASTQSPAQIDPAHRSALMRYLQASRTVVLLRHFGLPFAIRETAVKRWGFDAGEIGAREVAAMQAHIAEGELEDRLVEAHRSRLSAEDAVMIAGFYETEPGRRIIAANLQGMLPSSDPLMRGNLPLPAEADRQAFEVFLLTPAGARLNAVGSLLTKEVLRVQESLADLAVERYVAERKLSNRRAR